MISQGSPRIPNEKRGTLFVSPGFPPPLVSELANIIRFKPFYFSSDTYDTRTRLKRRHGAVRSLVDGMTGLGSDSPASYTNT